MTALAVRLNKRVTIQAPATGQDANGEPLTTFTNFVTDGDGKVWASIDDISGNEFISADATQNKVTTKIVIRKRTGVIASMRVLYGSVTYNIEAVLERANRTFLLMCSKDA